MGKRVLYGAFYVMMGCYAFIMLDLLFRFGLITSGREAVRSYNLVPFATIWEYASGSGGVTVAQSVRNLAGNVAVFIPLGLCLQVLLRDKRAWVSVGIVLAVSVAVELLQLALGVGACDVDDVILNTLGGALGVGLYRLLLRWLGDAGRAKRAAAVLSLVVGVPVVLVYLRVLLRRFFG